MNDMMLESLFFGVLVSCVTYELGGWLKKKTKISLINPLLFSIVAVIAILLACHIDYNTYYEGAKYLSYLLTPATVCLAVPLYEQVELLKKNIVAIIAGIISGALTSVTCVLVLAMIFHFSHEQYVTLLPKSITTAIGMGVSEELGGFVTITVAVIIITGIVGNIIAEYVCKLFTCSCFCRNLLRHILFALFSQIKHIFPIILVSETRKRDQKYQSYKIKKLTTRRYGL